MGFNFPLVFARRLVWIIVLFRKFALMFSHQGYLRGAAVFVSLSFRMHRV